MSELSLGGSLFGAKCPSVTVPHRDAVAVESLEQWHDDPSAASHLLANLTNGRTSIVPNELADQVGHALQTLRSHHDFRIDLDGLASIDQEPQRLLRSGIRHKLLQRGRIKRFGSECGAKLCGCGQEIAKPNASSVTAVTIC